MGRFDHILIVSDIDGTFLSRAGAVVARNLEALAYFRAEGGRFTFASGRGYYDLDTLIPNIRQLVNAPAILANGAYLYDFSENRPSAESFLEPGTAMDVVRMIARDYPDCGIRASTSAGFLTDSLVGRVGQDLANSAAYTTVKPISDWHADNWYKFVVRGDTERLDALRGAIEAGWPGGFNVCKSDPEILELLRVGCTKASALKTLRDVCVSDGAVPTVYAIGDYENDLELLRAADRAFCPTNAIVSVRAIASSCAVSCDDGAIAALVEIIDSETMR